MHVVNRLKEENQLYENSSYVLLCIHSDKFFILVTSL